MTEFICHMNLVVRRLAPARLIAKPNGEERLLKKVVKACFLRTFWELNCGMVYAGSEHKQVSEPEND